MDRKRMKYHSFSFFMSCLCMYLVGGYYEKILDTLFIGFGLWITGH